MQYVYMLQCADDTLYTGWTNDLTRRLAAHNSGRGAKYTRGRTPVRLVFSEIFAGQGEAMGYEAALKKLNRAQKCALIAAQQPPGAEYLDIYDSAGRVCGTRPRAEVHRQGLRHAVVHLWVLETRDGVPGLWLQQRAPDRPLYPGLYDQAATGHIGAGETPLTAVLREAQEEIGLSLPPEALTALPQPLSQRYARPDGGLDDERAHIFFWRRTQHEPFAPGAEVTRMVWVRADAFARAVTGADDRLPLSDGTWISAQMLACRHPAEWRRMRPYLMQGAP